MGTFLVGREPIEKAVRGGGGSGERMGKFQVRTPRATKVLVQSLDDLSAVVEVEIPR